MCGAKLLPQPLCDMLTCAGAAIGILPKIESADSVGHLSDILDAADGAMVARGDLGAELPVQEVSIQVQAFALLSQTLIMRQCRSTLRACTAVHSMQWDQSYFPRCPCTCCWCSELSVVAPCM